MMTVTVKSADKPRRPRWAGKSPVGGRPLKPVAQFLDSGRGADLRALAAAELRRRALEVREVWALLSRASLAHRLEDLIGRLVAAGELEEP
jgi:hypothetical protein